MNSHVPDLERCRKMKEMGFPQSNTLFCYRARYHEYIAAAPIVTELLAEIRKLVPDDWVQGFWDNEWWGADCDSYCDTPKAKRLEGIRADTLPNALADLWMELKGGKKNEG